MSDPRTQAKSSRGLGVSCPGKGREGLGRNASQAAKRAGRGGRASVTTPEPERVTWPLPSQGHRRGQTWSPGRSWWTVPMTTMVTQVWGPWMHHYKTRFVIGLMSPELNQQCRWWLENRWEFMRNVYVPVAYSTLFKQNQHWLIAWLLKYQNHWLNAIYFYSDIHSNTCMFM